MDDFRRATLRKVGPGGVRCSCCNAWPDAAALRRYARRQLRSELRQARDDHRDDD